jgi:hypothetical protein
MRDTAPREQAQAAARAIDVCRGRAGVKKPALTERYCPWVPVPWIVT